MTDGDRPSADDSPHAIPARPTRILIGDRHALFVEALHTALELHEFDVVGARTTWSGAERAIRTMRPELALLGGDFFRRDAGKAVGLIARHSPVTKVVIILSDEDVVSIRRTIDAGAAGYVHHTHGLSSLVAAIRRVVVGDVVVEMPVVVAQPRRGADHEVVRLAGYLTARERECLAMLVAGLGTNDMAERWCVSVTTVRTHIQAVLTKLGVHSRLQAATIAVRHGLVDEPYEAFDRRLAR